MKALKKIEKLEEENESLKETVRNIGCELSDEDLEVVIGGMSEGKLETYIADLLNEYRYTIFKS